MPGNVVSGIWGLRSAFGLIASFCLTSASIGPTLHAQEVISDEVTCSGCSITWTVEARMGDVDGPGAIPGIPHSMTQDAQDRFWVLFEGLPPFVFDSQGRFVDTAGRIGDGPGEFRAPVDVARAADSMVVYDRAGRFVVVGPDLSTVRTLRIHDLTAWRIQVLDWPHRVIANGSGGGSNLVGWPLHSLDLRGTEAVVETSFGGEGGTLLPGQRQLLQRHIGPVREGAFWAVRVAGNYRITRWSLSGTAQQRIDREAEWFPEDSYIFSGGPDTPPAPRTAGIHEDASRRLWVVGAVPSTEWRQAWRDAGIEELTGPIPVTELPSPADLRQTLVEIVDWERARVIWRETADAYPVGILDDGRLVMYRETTEGVPMLEIVRLELTGSPSELSSHSNH